MNEKPKNTTSLIGIRCHEGHEVPDICVGSTRKQYHCPGCNMRMFPLSEEQEEMVRKWDEEREHDV